MNCVNCGKIKIRGISRGFFAVALFTKARAVPRGDKKTRAAKAARFLFISM